MRKSPTKKSWKPKIAVTPVRRLALCAALATLGLPAAVQADEIDGRSLDIVQATVADQIATVPAPLGFRFLTLDLRFANTGTAPVGDVALGPQCSVLEDGLFPYFAEQVTGPVDQSALWQPQAVAPQEGFDASLVFALPAQTGALELVCTVGDVRFALPVAATEAVADAAPVDQPAEPSPETTAEVTPPAPEEVPDTPAEVTEAPADVLDAPADVLDAPPPAPTIALDAASYIPGATITATVSGLPGNPQDWVTLVAADASEDSFGEWSYTDGVTEGSFTFTAPDAPGAYEIRVYFDYPAGGTEVRARQAVTVEAPSPEPVAEPEPLPEPEPEPEPVGATLSADAAEFAPGERITAAFSVTAALPADAWVGLVPADLPHGDAAAASAAALDYRFLGGQTAGALPFFAPDAAGAYELRLYDSRSGGGELAAAALAVVAPAAPVTTDEPEVVDEPEPPAIEPTLNLATAEYAPGDPIEVAFTAPADWPPEAAVALVATDGGAVVAEMALGGATEGTLGFTAPDVGAYELRLHDGAGVAAAVASLTVIAPVEAAPTYDITLATDRETYRTGQPVEVSYAGLPGNENDWLTLVAADAPEANYGQWFYTEGATEGTMSFTAPEEPGAYEIRVLLAGASDVVSARLAVTVEGPPQPPAPATTPGLSLAQQVYAPGEPIILGFAAPADFPDQAWIGMFPDDAPHGSETVNTDYDLAWRYIEAVRDGQLQFTAPAEPGRYDFRLHDGDSQNALEVVSVAFAVSADGTAPAEPAPGPLVTPEAAVNVAAAPFGARAYGGSRPEALNDGNTTDYNNYDGYAYASIGRPMLLDLGRTVAVERLRMLIWNKDDRFAQYRIDGSADGGSWTTLVDRSSGEQRGWQEIELAPTPLRYLRVVGLFSSSGYENLEIVELEAYSRSPLPFATLAELVDASAVPLGRDLAYAGFGGAVLESPDGGAGSVGALTDGNAGAAAWVAPGPGPQELVLGFGGGQTARISEVLLRATPGTDQTRPRVVEIAAETGRILSPWTVVGRFGLYNDGGWHRLVFAPVEAPRIRVTVIDGQDPALPVALDEIVVLESEDAGDASILPGRHPGFAGGVNIAAAALGGRIERASASGNNSGPDQLIDGLLFNRGAVAGWFTTEEPGPKEVVVSFRGGREALIGGIALNPDAGIDNESGYQTMVRTFEIWVSNTGPDSGFTQVGGFVMDEGFDWQGFDWHVYSFEPVRARYVMLKITSTYGRDMASLGEFEVLEATAPDYRSILADDPPNLAATALGGHLAVPTGANKQALLDGQAGPPSWFADDGTTPPYDITLAFRDDRTATIDSITLTPPTDMDQADWVREVKVSVSTTSPVDGFTTVGTFAMGPQPRPQSFSFAPVEARYVQLRVLSNNGGEDYGLGEVAVHEHFVAGAQSVLSRLASEAEGLPPLAEAPTLPGEPEPNDTVAAATPIVLGETAEGLIAPPDDVDLYRIDTRNEPYPGITVTVAEAPVLRVGLELLDAGGQPIAQQPLYEQSGDRATFSWALPQGEYYLRVYRPLTSIVVQSDLSPSTDNVRDSITGALSAFVDQTTEFERVSIAGFCGGHDRAVEFTNDPALLRQAVEAINYGCGGTDLYGAMHLALDWLAPELGAKAIVVVTDGEDTNSGYDPILAELYRRLGEAGVRVYGIGYGQAVFYQVADGTLAATGGDLLRSWAAATGGRYFEAPSGDAINQVAARIAEELRRPSLYQVTVTTPQGEGGLSVVEVGESIAGVAAPSRVSLIFDASGSMWGRDDAGTPKIEIARQVMRAVINGMPEQIQVGLRIYGHRYPREPKARSCTDTELVVPFGPLDRGRLIGAIDGLNPQGQTPIGLSLASLRQDFAGVEGQKVVILVTDGIETCDPDPGNPNYPPDVVRQLLAEGLEVRVNVVGFDIDESATREFLRQISDLSGGQYFDAADATQLQAALEEAIRANFTVADARGEVVGTGQVNDPPLMLVEGVYDVTVEADPPIVAEAVVTIDEETRILLNKEGEAVGVEVESRDLALATVEPTPTPDVTPTDTTPSLPPAASLDARTLVQEIQQRLGAQGYDPGPADGIAGPGTRDAIRAYQQANGLPVDGLATAALLEDLRARAAATAPTSPATTDGTFGAGSTFGSGDVPEPGPEPVPDSTSTITSTGPATSTDPGSPADRVSYFPAPRTMYAAQSSSRVRSGPGTDYDQVGSIPFAGQVTVLGELDGWYYLETANGIRGFTAASLLSTTRPTISSGRTPPIGPSAPTPTVPAVPLTCPPGETLIEVGPNRHICARLQ